MVSVFTARKRALSSRCVTKVQGVYKVSIATRRQILLRHKPEKTYTGSFTADEIMNLASEISASQMLRGPVLGSPRDGVNYVVDYLKHTLAAARNEVFMLVFLDNRHRVIATEAMFYGTVDGASVHPRAVVDAAMKHNAVAVIAAHNHPSGVAEPSAADIAITRRLADALALIDVRLLDHYVVSDAETAVSLAERGLL